MKLTASATRRTSPPGVIYVVFGAGFALGALNYKLGEAGPHGARLVPASGIGVLLALVGPADHRRRGARARRARTAQAPGAAARWPGSSARVVLFGVLLQPLGLVRRAGRAGGGRRACASHEFSWQRRAAQRVVLILFSVGVFIYGINLQLPLWPAFLPLRTRTMELFTTSPSASKRR